jgi:hypothetical protein
MRYLAVPGMGGAGTAIQVLSHIPSAPADGSPDNALNNRRVNRDFGG